MNKNPATHKTKNIIIKRADVDIGIIPVVNWLNSFEEVHTEWSCQGNHNADNSNRAHVVFYCQNSLSLIRIAQAIEFCATIKVEFYKSGLRYFMQFNTIELLNHFINDYINAK